MTTDLDDAMDSDPSARIEQLETALNMLLNDVEGGVDYGMPFEDPEHGFHESVMAARRALGKVDYIALARRKYKNDTITIDNDASLSEADDGAWVSAWVWVKKP